MFVFLSGDNNHMVDSWTDAILGSWKMGLQGAAVGLDSRPSYWWCIFNTSGSNRVYYWCYCFGNGSSFGEDKLNKNMEDAETNIMALADDLKTTGNRVYNFFKGIVDAGKAMVRWCNYYGRCI